MDPNNNQPASTNPFGQPVTPQPAVNPSPVPEPAVQPQPQSTPPPTPNVVPTPISTSIPETPKKGNKKAIILIAILLILILGIGFYILLVKNQSDTAQKTANESTSTAIPAVIPTVTPATVDEITVENPDTDLKTIESDVQGL